MPLCVQPFHILLAASALLVIGSLYTYKPDISPRYLISLIPLPTKDQASIPDSIDDFVADATFSSFPVHFIRFYPSPPNQNDTLCWVQCLSLLSVMIYIKPQYIYIHTNHPDFWPFDKCSTLITNWTSVRLVSSRRRFTIGGRRLQTSDRAIRHEADIAKLFILYRHGGIALDFDIFILPRISHLLMLLEKKYDCITTRESVNYTNIGFLACRKGAGYVRDVLNEYIRDYRPMWIHNSGWVPWQLYKNSSVHKSSVYMDEKISMNPNWGARKRMSEHWGKVEWKNKPAYHAYYSDCALTENGLRQRNTSLFELFSSIVKDGRRVRPG